MSAANIAATLGDTARDAAARWLAEAAARACPRDYAAARIGAASAWIGDAGRIAATADRLDNAAELCCSRSSWGALSWTARQFE